MTQLTAIPLVLSASDAKLVSRFYAEAKIVRLELESAPRLAQELSGFEKWVDPGMDVLGQARKQINPNRATFMSRHGLDELIDDEGALSRPSKERMRTSIYSLLNETAELNPKWISVPQVPMVADSSRNRLNRMFADLTAEWALDRRFHGSFVLPVITTHRNQTRGKTQRTPKLGLVKDCFLRSGAKAVWVVDASLDDQRVAEDHRKWFDGLVAFHEELRAALPASCVVLGGPYWGLNLVLWVRGAIDFPVISVGTGFQYYLSGGYFSRGKARIAIPPLRRTAVVEGLQEWLQNAIEVKSQFGDERTNEMRELLRDWQRLILEDQAKAQVARFYREWINRLEETPRGGQALAFYQDLSRAYVFASDLPELPASEKGRSKEPGRVAELLMLTTLG